MTYSAYRAGLEYLTTAKPWMGDGNFDLCKVRRVLAYLGDPQDALPSIHVAGTNGKGSVSSAVASILGASGYRVGLNVSPHLSKINERIVVDGVSVDDAWLGQFARDVRDAATRMVEKLSFHEAITCVAFLGFREFGLEWSVIEVGLGGRLDASNVIKRPVVSCITSIDYDHQDILGNSLSSIASEKAGISKPGAPLIVGPVAKEALASIRKVASKVGVSVLSYGIDFAADFVSYDEQARPKFNYRSKRLVSNHESFTSSLVGSHQIYNMSVALEAAIGIGISIDACRRGLEQVFWPARFERFVYRGNRSVTIDCAHNPAGVKAFISVLDTLGIGSIDLTFGVLETKQWREMVKMLAPRVNYWRLLSPQSNRAVSMQLLVDELKSYNARFVVYDQDQERYMLDLERGDTGQDLFACGSIYLIGKLRELFGRSAPQIWRRETNELR